MSKRKPNWTDREKVVLLEEHEKRKVILKAKFSSSITSGCRKKWDNTCDTTNTEVSLYLNLSINSKTSYISNGLVLSLKIRSHVIAVLTSSIRYRLTWNIVVTICNFEMSLYGQTCTKNQ